MGYMIDPSTDAHGLSEGPRQTEGYGRTDAHRVNDREGQTDKISTLRLDELAALGEIKLTAKGRASWTN